MGQILLETRNLYKRYGNLTALDHVSLSLEENKIYGLLGRNGAGKTTFLNLITSRIFPDGGTIRAFGENVTENPRVLSKICYMPEKNMFMQKMRVRTTLRFAAEFFESFDTAYALRLCEKFGLDGKKAYNALSRGYESILRIVIGLASRAPLTIFDEPVLGLDAAVRDIFYRELIDDYAEHPRTFLISTHLIEESAELFEEAVIIKEGRLSGKLPVEELRKRGVAVSGKRELVSEAVAGLNVIHTEDIASVRICTLFDEPGLLERLDGMGLDLSPVPVQKLFIYLTDTKKESV